MESRASLPGPCFPPQNCESFSPYSRLVVGLLDQVFDDAVRLVDVLQGTMTQAMGKAVIFLLFDVMTGRVEQFQGAMITASASHVVVDGRMVIQILAIINRGVLDLCDRLVDLRDGVIFFSIHPAGPCPTLQMSARVAEVGESVQVGRMSPGIIREGHGGTDSNQKHDYGTMSYSLHSLLE